MPPQDGRKSRVIQYEYLDGSAGFTNALKDFKEHFRSYIWRWEHGDKGEENDGG